MAWLVIIRYWVWLRQDSFVVCYDIRQSVMLSGSSITGTTLCSIVHIYELVSCICLCHEYNALKSIVVEVQ